MKRKLLSICILLCLISINNRVYAEENEEGETNNLDLGTEILNNKKEDYSSTTAIGDINLFSEDYKQILLEETNILNTNFEFINDHLFSDESIEVDVQNTSQLFNKPMEMDNSVIEEKQNNNNITLIMTCFIGVSLITFILTKIKYQNSKKRGNEDAINYYNND